METTNPLPRSTATSYIPSVAESSVENELQLSTDLPRVFTYEELKEATDNFKEELGRGSYGTVYKGKLNDERMVAVKEITERNQKQRDQFSNEVNILSCLDHENLVALYGFTNMDKELLLVYGLVPNGTLSDHLHGLTHLTLSVRIDIAIETAKALSYLHSQDPQIVHLNVKPASILLDHSFHVKVAGLRLGQLLPQDKPLSTLTQSTLGYEDPEYQQCLTVTDKSDVYSFGVVLVELISRKKVVDVERPAHGEEIYLDLMALNKIRRNKLGQLVDRELGYDDNLDVKRIIRSVARLVRRCLEPKRKDRPLMREVLEDLEGIRKEMQETYEHTSQKLILQVPMDDDNCRSTVMKVAASTDGAHSVSIEGEDRDQLVVTGDGVDATLLMDKLRKEVGHQICVLDEKKIVINVLMNDVKQRSKAMMLACSLNGVTSVRVEGDNLEVIGVGIDAVRLVAKLRTKLGFAELVSIAAVKGSADKVNTRPLKANASPLDSTNTCCIM